MADSYVVVGSLLAVLASTVLFLRDSKPKKDKLAEEMLRISQQMKMYKETAVPAASAIKSNVEESPEYPGGRVAILFGSQTGTAEGFAEVLKKEGRKAGFQTQTIDLENYDAASLLQAENIVILIMATYGEGDPTDNAIGFIDYLKDKNDILGPRTFEGVNFTVFGLGNTQYEHYNAIGRLTNRLMEKYGGKRIYNYGEGDDDASLDEDFAEWKEQLWKTLRSQFIANDNDHKQDESINSLPFEYEYRVVEICQPKRDAMKTEARLKASTKHFLTAKQVKIVVNRQLRRSTEGGSTVHVELDLRGTGITYETADNLAVLPENESRIVEKLATRLGFDLEQWVLLKPVVNDLHCDFPFPSPCTVRDILTRYLAINSAPRKDPLKQLAFFAVESIERAMLTRLGSKDGKLEYQKWIIDDERSFVDVLAHFGSVKVSLQDLLHLVPSLLPRYYTISSSSLVSPQRIHATVSLIESQKDDNRVFRGVCSNYLGSLLPLDVHMDERKKRESRPGEQGSKKPREWPMARIFIRASSFRLPTNPLTPVILIGPGTGIAPMRAFLQERAKQQEDGIEVGKSIMYFGCRRRKEDFLYQDELELYKTSGVLSQLHVAFSREQQKKVYVQHLLLQHGQETWQLLHDQDAHIYICGATAMGNEVHRALLEIIVNCGHQTAEEALTTLKRLQDDHRYVQELWA
ncbi:hypothetical protein CCR75_004108 [Bremia lactucae]|uniref:NADPH--hemoprotein reductase n=1 Tax=Bremia lactucae TaxID=4779 RepID=A0A976FKA5_BRELC|nr:hypothetical protein CCR75_004108 [Bremia lactucae]